MESNCTHIEEILWSQKDIACPKVRYREMAQHIAELQNSAGPPAHKMTPKGFFQHFSSDSTEAHIQHEINMRSTYGIKLYAY